MSNTSVAACALLIVASVTLAGASNADDVMSEAMTPVPGDSAKPDSIAEASLLVSGIAFVIIGGMWYGIASIPHGEKVFGVSWLISPALSGTPYKGASAGITFVTSMLGLSAYNFVVLTEDGISGNRIFRDNVLGVVGAVSLSAAVHWIWGPHETKASDTDADVSFRISDDWNGMVVVKRF